VPFELIFAIEHASRVCDWQENLVSEECPPAWMWAFDEELEIWFEQVDQARKAKYNLSDNDDTTVPMMSNELARGRR